jgi:hypothetical protein
VSTKIYSLVLVDVLVTVNIQLNNAPSQDNMEKDNDSGMTRNELNLHGAGASGLREDNEMQDNTPVKDNQPEDRQTPATLPDACDVRILILEINTKTYY